MSRIVINKIIVKLGRLDEYLHYLRELQKLNKRSFLADYHTYGLAERYLQLAIEVLLDIGKLIVIAKNTRRPEDNQDIIAILGEQKVLSPALRRRLDGIAQFRNILVHDYEKIDREIVYKKLRTHLEDFSAFRRAIVRFLR